MLYSMCQEYYIRLIWRRVLRIIKAYMRKKKIISKAKEGKTTSIISLDEQLRCQISLGDLLFDVGVVGR